ncbi:MULTISPECIES: acyl carrier protein [Vibrio]|jgi:acyl carrier protein|uniref:acyl carrier protein n=1 Tax=Vibrio TaxID=662 RepID=UPI000BFFB60E|nr:MULTISPECIES: acyl carrier protein [unclassified Vibrio]PHJ43544.1 phosphopantetheine-binding protein [Vibrio sp. PID17_43]RIZ55059.1 phosphopantetheine-binding protein [Vibrio sp. PID23_8]
MNNDTITASIAQALSRIAPEIEIDDIDINEDLREECDLDSMDFLNLLTSIKQSTGVSIPESDYAKVRSYNQLQQYLQMHIQ